MDAASELPSRMEFSSPRQASHSFWAVTEDLSASERASRAAEIPSRLPVRPDTRERYSDCADDSCSLRSCSCLRRSSLSWTTQHLKINLSKAPLTAESGKALFFFFGLIYMPASLHFGNSSWDKKYEDRIMLFIENMKTGATRHQYLVQPFSWCSGHLL